MGPAGDGWSGIEWSGRHSATLLKGGPFCRPREGDMDTTSIVVIAIAVVFMGIIGGLALYANRPEKNDKDKAE
jgi:hypothetical protein